MEAAGKFLLDRVKTLGGSSNQGINNSDPTSNVMVPTIESQKMSWVSNAGTKSVGTIPNSLFYHISKCI